MDLQAAYLIRRQAELDELDAEFKTLEFKAQTVRAAQGVELYNDLQDLRTRLADTRHTLDELQDSRDAHWEAGKEKLEGSWRDLEGVLERVHKRVE